ncbi:hypothetical protein WMF26_49920 [Sorangium sp. So ce185]|uniref:hypothetical protein n=1 Tax=Sorangium sp. So ce185 TaxID=3133287 RepID=UPI003F635BD2
MTSVQTRTFKTVVDEALVLAAETGKERQRVRGLPLGPSDGAVPNARPAAQELKRFLEQQSDRALTLLRLLMYAGRDPGNPDVVRVYRDLSRKPRAREEIIKVLVTAESLVSDLRAGLDYAGRQRFDLERAFIDASYMAE